jgi:O-methyltransferase
MLKHIALRVIEAAGYDIARRGTRIAASRRAETSAELEALYREFVFPDLPPCAGRADLIALLEGTAASEAIYIAAYLHRSLRVPGAICEFGVAQGATSAFLANEMRATDRQLFLFDSFEGLPRPTARDVLVDDIFQLGSMDAYEGKMAFERHHVVGRLRAVEFPLSRVMIVPGFIEKTIHSPGLPAAVAFAYVDFDLYEPIAIALQFLDGVTQRGAHVVVDDYGWFSAGAQSAVDEFVGSRATRWRLTKPLPFAGKFAVLERFS